VGPLPVLVELIVTFPVPLGPVDVMVTLLPAIIPVTTPEVVTLDTHWVPFHLQDFSPEEKT
jgi:hypothetical protein